MTIEERRALATEAAVPLTSAPAGRGSPEWWLDRLSRRLTERAGRTGDEPTGMELYDAYYHGRHRQTYKIRKVVASFGLRMPLFVNYCGVVVDSLAERLAVESFRFGDGKDGDAASAAAWDLWQANSLDARFNRGIRSGLTKGEFALHVWPRADGQVGIWVEDGSQVIVTVDPETQTRRAALKRWLDEDEQAIFATLYLPDAIYKYRSGAATAFGSAGQIIVGGTAWEPRLIPGEPWPAPNPYGVVPIIPIPNNPDHFAHGASELEVVVPIQDAINANIANVMLAGLYGAFRQRYAVNVRLEVDPETGATIQPWNVAEDSLFTAEPLEDPNKNVEFGEFSETPLTGYISLHETYIQAIGTTTRIPPHYFLGTQGTFPSGEALTAVERGLAEKAGERGVDIAEPVEEAMRLAFRMKAGQTGQTRAARSRYERWAAMTDAECKMRDPETKSESQHVDSLVKLRALEVPRRAIWARIPASEQDIRQWEEWRKAEAAEAPTPEQTIEESPPEGGGPVDSSGGPQLPS